MSGYDGPSIFRQQKKDDQSPSKPAQVKSSSRRSSPRVSQREKIEKPSLKHVALSRIQAQDRTSTPYKPTQLPSREYFQKRYQEGTKQGVKERYGWISRQMKVDDDDLLLFEHRLDKDLSLFEEEEDLYQDHNRPRRGLNSQLEIDFDL